MPQSKVQTHEKEKMAAFKQSLVTRVETTLIPSESESESGSSTEKIILLLPAGYENLSEAGLYKALTLNTELQHTPQTAVLAIEALKVWNSKALQISELEASLKQYKLDLINLTSRIKSTEQKLDDCLFNTSSNIQFMVIEDIVEKESVSDFELIEESYDEDFEPVLVKEGGVVVYKVPVDFEIMTEPQLVFNLSTRFRYSKRVASDLVAILTNKSPKPINMEFELV